MQIIPRYTAPELGRRILRAARSTSFAALAVYVVLALAATYPFLLSPHNTMTAPLASDFTSSVTVYGAYIDSGADPFTARRINSVAQPDGLPNSIGVNRVSALSVLYLWLGSLVVGPIMAHSLETFLGYVLTAFVMFLLVKRVTRSPGAAFVAGLIYGFWPLMLGLGRAEPTYTHMWLYLLPIWAFWELVNDPRKKRVILAAASILPAMYWTPYFAFHILLVGASCLLVALLFLRERLGAAKALLLAGGFIVSWALACAMYYAVGVAGSTASDIPTRTAAEAYQQSAHPLMYVLPGESSVLGKNANDLLVRLVPRAAHTSLYVGLSVLALAAFGFICSLKTRGGKRSSATWVASVMCATVALCCFAFSLAPTITLAGHTIATPNDLVIKAVPALRAGQRLVMPLMGALAALAGVGAYFALRQVHGRWKYLLLAGLVGLVGVDLWSPYDDSSTKVVASPAIVALKDLPSGRVAQYRLSSLVGYPAQVSCLAQEVHRQPIINDCGLFRSAASPAMPTPQLAKLVALPLCQQLQGMRLLDVRYVIVEKNDRPVLDCLRAHNDTEPILQDSTYKIFRL